jgi:hypothetical protein
MQRSGWGPGLGRTTVNVVFLAVLVIAATVTVGLGVAFAVSKATRPPAPTITAAPANPTSATAASFSFSDTQAGVNFQCALDGGSSSNCTSPKAYSGLADGTHTFRVTASANGAQSAATAFTWVVSTQPPTAALAFPANLGSYNAAGWTAGCSSAGLCGSAADLAGITQVQLSLRRSATGLYWSGSSFNATSAVFVAATVASPNAPSTTWSYALPASAFPADGAYVADVRSVDRLGRQTAAGQDATAQFSIDRTAPPAPSLTATPDDPTFNTSASFSFSDSDATATFECSLDGGAFTACSSGQSYGSLSVATHQFAVRAVDPAGNRSSATGFGWTIVARGNFPVSGTLSAAFYPGGSAVPIDLVISNPYNFALSVTAATVSVTGTSAAGCSASANFTVVQNLTATVVIPAGMTRSLSQLGIAQSAWPQVRMVDTGLNQDACRGASVSFSFSAAGTKANQ